MVDRGLLQVERTKEGVPIWDGNAATFQEYSELAQHWEQSVAHHKRYLCGPRLQSELTGTARRFVMSMKPGWISYAGGVQRLLDHLRKHLGQPQLTEMSEYLGKYFKQSRRKRHESMNDYITRKGEIYARACQTLHRVSGRYAREVGPRTGGATSQHTWNGWQQLHGGHSDHTAGMSGGSLPPENEEEEEQSFHDAAESWEHYDSWGAPDWNSGSWGNPHSNSWSDSAWTRPWNTSGQEPAWEKEITELIPTYVQGWFLLQDAGLDAQEKNLILTALKDDFSVERVAQELRNQWPDQDLKHKDQSGKSTAWTVDECDELEEASCVDRQGPDLSCLVNSGLNDEGLSIMEEAEQDANEALAMMDHGRKTLREARAKQHQVKMSRQYYKTDRISVKPSFSNRPAASLASIKCLNCGVLGHKVAQCPKRALNQTASVSEAQTSESAPFVCSATDLDSAHVASGGLTTQEAVSKGMAILDGGATRTLGSVSAVEKLMELNQTKTGHDGVTRIDHTLRPTFGFGNSSSDKCMSTAWLSVQAGGRGGELKVHTLDRGHSPILFSIETLRSLGALIDFEHDLLVFRKLDPTRVISLERSCTGHQLLPLSEDWFSRAKTAKNPVPSLEHYI